MSDTYDCCPCKCIMWRRFYMIRWKLRLTAWDCWITLIQKGALLKIKLQEELVSHIKRRSVYRDEWKKRSSSIKCIDPALSIRWSKLVGNKEKRVFQCFGFWNMKIEVRKSEVYGQIFDKIDCSKSGDWGKTPGRRSLKVSYERQTSK